MQVTPPKAQLTDIENGKPGLIVRVHNVATLSMSQANGRKKLQTLTHLDDANQK